MEKKDWNPNYTIQCTDIKSGETGCFLFDIEYYNNTGKFKAISRVYKDLIDFYTNERGNYVDYISSRALQKNIGI